jgi:hypothetical protein
MPSFSALSIPKAKSSLSSSESLFLFKINSMMRDRIDWLKKSGRSVSNLESKNTNSPENQDSNDVNKYCDLCFKFCLL